ncbi:MAG: zinc finger HIT domain-containing protein [Haloferacaceae archaeon]
MSTPALCGICEAAPAEYTCDRCGTAVCAEHFDERSGLCVECASRGGRDVGPDAGGRR